MRPADEYEDGGKENTGEEKIFPVRCGGIKQAGCRSPPQNETLCPDDPTKGPGEEGGPSCIP
jgi:hypothetical protein